MIQRGQLTQMYVLQGLHEKVHFTIGSKALQKFQTFLREKCIRCQIFYNKSQVTSNVLYLRNMVIGAENNIERIYTKKMTDLACELWPCLLSPPKVNSKKRASHVLDLGITDQKVHLQNRSTITG